MAGFQQRSPVERLTPVPEAQQLVLDSVLVLETERVSLQDALGRVLREDIRAPRDVPDGDNSAMDGYAARSEDIAGAAAANPVALEVIEDVPAGRVAARRVEPGTAIRIMTGGLIPDGADVVVPVELTDAGADRVLVREAVPSRRNIRARGEDMKTGDLVLPDGIPIGAAELGVLASVQRPVVTVGRRPVVTVLSTGDEIIDVDGAFTRGKVVNSNSYSLAALVRETGCIARMTGIVRDTREATRDAIEASLESDFVISSGGVSVGAYDFVQDALEDLGATTHLWQVAMKPGKPVVLSSVRGRTYFGLPGNPVSCMVSFHLFVAPALRKAMGQKESLLPPIMTTRLDGRLEGKGDRPSYMRVRLAARGGVLTAVPMPSQGSGVSTSMVRAAGLVIVNPGDVFERGADVATVVIGPVES